MKYTLILLALLAVNVLAWGWSLRRALGEILPECNDDQRFVWAFIEVVYALLGMLTSAVVISFGLACVRYFA